MPGYETSLIYKGAIKMNLLASYHQERIWFIDKFERNALYADGPIYHNIPLIIEIKGILNPDILEQSIAGVISRHEALRTRIVTIKDQPYQVIDPEPNFTLEISDLTGRPEESAWALDLAIVQSKQPFMIENGKLIRGTLFKRKPDRWLLVITIHHLICDKYSLGVIAREIPVFYQAISQERTPDLPELPLQFGWRRFYFTGNGNWAENCRHWNCRLTVPGRPSIFIMKEDAHLQPGNTSESSLTCSPCGKT
jgi:hypothetical protein